MPQFFVNAENLNGETIIINDNEDIKHINSVLRYSIGDILDISTLDGNIYKAKIKNIAKDCIETEIKERLISDKKLKNNIILAQSIIKSSKQDIVIQKASELGVNLVIPITTKNTVIRFKTDKDKWKKVQRWQKIAIETVKQCERVNLPEVSGVKTLVEFLDWHDKHEFDYKFVCTERDHNSSIKQCLKDIEKPSENKNILIVIGPEGGWSDEELSLFKQYNFELVTLGRMILRAETAAINAVSQVSYEFEIE